jgi:hypothetical protein
MVLEQVAFVDAGVQQCIALKIQHLPVAVRGDPHVADQHVRKTSSDGFRTVYHSDRVCRARFCGK